MTERRSTQPNEMIERVALLKDHYILCGVGATGIFIAEELHRSNVSFVVIEQDPAAIRQLQSRLGPDMLCLQGDATEDDILEQAGIARATGLIATLREDKDNVFAILTARSLNSQLRIVTRVAEQENVEKLRQAGADVITDPNHIGGMRLASQMIRPEVVAFVDHMFRVSNQAEKLRLTEVSVDEMQLPALQSGELTIADIGQNTEFLIIAVKRGGRYIYRPRGGLKLRRGTEAQSSDALVVIATQAQLDKVRGGN